MRSLDIPGITNALLETINGMHGTQFIPGQSWKIRETFELTTFLRAVWFSQRPLLEPIGNMPPAGAEANYRRQNAVLTMAAQSPNNRLGSFATL